MSDESNAIDGSVDDGDSNVTSFLPSSSASGGGGDDDTGSMMFNIVRLLARVEQKQDKQDQINTMVLKRLERLEDLDNAIGKVQEGQDAASSIGCIADNTKRSGKINTPTAAAISNVNGVEAMQATTSSLSLPSPTTFQIQAFLEHMAKKQEDQMAHIFQGLQQIESIISAGHFAAGSQLPSLVDNVDDNKQDVRADGAMTKKHVSVPFSNGTSLQQQEQQQKDKKKQAPVEKKQMAVDDEVDEEENVDNSSDDKLASLQESGKKRVESYESSQADTKTTSMMMTTTTTTMESKDIDETKMKSRTTKLSNIGNKLKNINRRDQSFCNSFAGPFVWKDRNSRFFQLMDMFAKVAIWVVLS